jgi:hypothetical protein
MMLPRPTPEEVKRMRALLAPRWPPESWTRMKEQLKDPPPRPAAAIANEDSHMRRRTAGIGAIASLLESIIEGEHQPAATGDPKAELAQKLEMIASRLREAELDGRCVRCGAVLDRPAVSSEERG